MLRKIKRSVFVRGIQMGGGSPVTIQSMTNTDTADVGATVEQIKRLERAGCEIVRASVYNEDCVKAIPAILERISIPLVADIHFDHRLAIGAMKNGVHKIRFNPGNIGNAANVRELVACAKDCRVPIRVGVNAGSLEKSMLERFGGPTPEAMVESALKHVAILEREGFYDTVISIKASNVPDTFAAYRMADMRCDYPLHLGVTEAGMGAAALVKSSVGIGSLLLEGIGDTLRVSLTGDPALEAKTATLVLRAVGLRKDGVEIVSCPTCGRCGVDLEKVVRRVETELPQDAGYLKVAVMGCAVNGPGEAREADIGIAFGETNAVVFRHGEREFAGPLPDVIDQFLQAAKDMLN